MHNQNHSKNRLFSEGLRSAAKRLNQHLKSDSLRIFKRYCKNAQ